MASTCPVSVHEMRRAQRANGPAAVLAIGTATPATCVSQEEYPDYYFRVTKSDHHMHLKDDLKKLCELTGTKKHFFHHTEDMFNARPELLDRALPSLDTRLAIAATVVPELAALAAAKAIDEWGRPATDITDLVMATSGVGNLPSADLRLASILGLRPTVRRTMLQLNGFYGGAAALRLAKDLAENTRGARVLVACAEVSVVSLRGLREQDGEEECFQTLVTHALFGDGAGAAIVGADYAEHEAVERPLFEMVLASQTVVPGTEHVLTMQIKEHGIDNCIHIDELLQIFEEKHVERCVTDALGSLGLAGIEWNDLFWAVHPGGRGVLDHIEKNLELEPGKLASSRMVLREYGNMLGATIFFVLDEQRRRMEAGAKWGVMLGFGPGFTIETMVLHAPPVHVHAPKN